MLLKCLPVSQPWGGRVWEGEIHFYKGFLFLKFSFLPEVLFLQRKETIPWVKTAGWVPYSWRKHSRCQIRSDWPGESSSQPGSAGWQGKGEGETALTPPGPVTTPSLPYSQHCRPLSPVTPTPTWGRSSERPKHSLTPNPDPCSVTKLKREKKKRISSLITTEQLQAPKKTQRWCGMWRDGEDPAKPYGLEDFELHKPEHNEGWQQECIKHKPCLTRLIACIDRFTPYWSIYSMKSQSCTGIQTAHSFPQEFISHRIGSGREMILMLY